MLVLAVLEFGTRTGLIELSLTAPIRASQQLRQLGDIRRDPASLGGCTPGAASIKLRGVDKLNLFAERHISGAQMPHLFDCRRVRGGKSQLLRGANEYQ